MKKLTPIEKVAIDTIQMLAECIKLRRQLLKVQTESFTRKPVR